MKFSIATLMVAALLTSCSNQPTKEASRKYATSESVYSCVDLGTKTSIAIVDSTDSIEITYSDDDGVIAKWTNVDSFPDQENRVYFAQGNKKNMKSLYINLVHKKVNKYSATGSLKNLNWVFSDPIENKYIQLENFECTGG